MDMPSFEFGTTIQSLRDFNIKIHKLYRLYLANEKYIYALANR
jgi:hypothetical protein